MGISTKIEELINLANKGDVQAQNDLGECYYTGEGVEQDYVKAVEWVKKAADQGYVEAQKNLAVCYYNVKRIRQQLP